MNRDPADFLAACEVIDCTHPSIVATAAQIADGKTDRLAIARDCFHWVRDKIRHSNDFRCNPVTCVASDVLKHGTGYCFAKSHLLTALLRANGIPAGLCYQRLSIDGKGPPFCLHGLSAVYLDRHGWYRIDPRGNTDGVDAQFDPPHERLAFTAGIRGECNLPGICIRPLGLVVRSLMTHETWEAMAENLPDMTVGEKRN
jgi:transglutaminase-like putative cysteine protease